MCADIFRFSTQEDKLFYKMTYNCIIHEIFDILRGDIKDTFPPGWAWQAYDEDELREHLENHDEARNLDRNEVAYISFNPNGDGYFHITPNNPNFDQIKTGFQNMFGQHVWPAQNEAEFSGYLGCSEFARQFAEHFNLKTISVPMQNDYVQISFCIIDLEVLYDKMESIEDDQPFRYDFNEHSTLQRAGSIQYHDFFVDYRDGDTWWVASEPQNHIRVLWKHVSMSSSVFEVRIRNNRLKNLVVSVLQMHGAEELEYDDRMLFEIPHTGTGTNRHKRRRFLSSLPFLEVQEASKKTEIYIDTVPRFIPENFAEAIVDYKYGV